ncbi:MULTISPECIES: GNAT family N-acetyltransferase [Pacificibacter]|uniref:GNAT family N-acetyltransferase n=1 Tax=Pacificibacter TaxID=1042323 RepID=UPI001C09B849|nr:MULTISPECIES: GNAT family N-acetyltransferase [Pacificibacter]MBU2935258.1 GNAT family N-acetyltransferase [Pacificibacter marinus]MDO6615412.1 GNAT family N-acetyltransferase [Pacificibacter sp. 1_MG-2023]
MNDIINIRPAQDADGEAVRACAHEAYAQYVAAIGRKPAPMTADYAGLIAAGHVHVATDAQSGVLGFIVFYPDGTDMVLENIAVRSVAMGRGIGKRLIGFCERRAKQSSLTAVRLYTNEKMTENLSIYPHLGYREIERRSEQGFNRVFFVKDL